MDSYEVSTNTLESQSKIEPKTEKKESHDSVIQQMGISMRKFFTQNVFFTLTGHEYKLAIQARVQKIWFYFGVFYSILMLFTSRNVSAIQSTLVLFVNFGTIFAFIPASSSISGEIGGIADTILSKSVRRWQYILSKHIAYILVVWTTYGVIIGGLIGTLAAMKAFESSLEWEYLLLIIGLDALILAVFTSLGVFLSSLFTKPIFPILGNFVGWFLLIFLFILFPTWDWKYSPVVINTNFPNIIQNVWDIKYWPLFTVYGSICLMNIGISIGAFYRLDF